MVTTVSDTARKAGHELSVTIDPRRHDAVLFALEHPLADPAVDRLERRLHRAGVRTATLSAADPVIAAADRLGVRPGRTVVVTDSEAGVAAAAGAGFALVLGVRDGGPAADVLVGNLDAVTVRAGYQPMSAVPNALGAPKITDAVAAGNPAVFFDFDGTLSEIVDDPAAATLVDGAAEALRALAARCPVAVLSGRDLADVRERVGLSGIWYAGSHGFESTDPDGRHHQNDVAAAAVPVLAEAAAELHARLAEVPGVLVEQKRFAVAVHYRNAARDRVGDVVAAVRATGRRDALRVTTGRAVIELRPAADWDKGQTLRWIVERLSGPPGYACQLLPIYLGDDITDEDAFDAVRPSGIPIVVRHTEDGDRPTAARYALENPMQVVAFTAGLADQLGAGR